MNMCTRKNINFSDDEFNINVISELVERSNRKQMYVSYFVRRFQETNKFALYKRTFNFGGDKPDYDFLSFITKKERDVILEKGDVDNWE